MTGGKREGAGRPLGSKKPEVKPRAISLTDAEHAIYVQVGGARRKPGRPRAEPTKPVMLRLTDKQRLKYLELGGAIWIKRLINEAMTKGAQWARDALDKAQ